MKSKILYGFGLLCAVLALSPNLKANIVYIDSIELENETNHEMFLLEDFESVDRDGVSSGDFQVTKTDSYVYGKNKLWISLSKTPTKDNYWYYALAIDGTVWAEGKHSKDIWFSTKSVEYTVTLDSDNMMFSTVPNNNYAVLDPAKNSYGNSLVNDIVINEDYSDTQHIKNDLSIYTQKQLNRIKCKTEKIYVNSSQKKVVDISYNYSDYNSNRSTPCAGYFHQCAVLVLKSDKSTASISVTMNASFFKDKKLGNNYTKEANPITLEVRA